MNSVILLIVFIPLAIYLIEGIRHGLKVKTWDQFFLADRKLRLTSFIINTAATNFSFLTAVFVLISWAYAYGPAVWWTIITAFLGFLFYSIPKISPIKDEKFFSTGNTLHEYLGIRYNSNSVRFIASLCTVTAFIGFFIAEVYIFAGFLSQYLPISFWKLIILLAFIACFYTLLGGFFAVVKTDLWQFFFIILGSIIFLYLLGAGPFDLKNTLLKSFNLSGLFKPIPPFQAPPLLFVAMTFVLNSLWYFSAMTMWQRSLAAKYQKTISRGALYGGLVFCSIAIPVILIGIGMRLLFPSDNLGPFEIISELLKNKNPLILGGILTFFCSAFLSTADSNLIALSQSLLYDIIGIIRRKKAEIKFSLSAVRISILIITVASLLFLYLYQKLFKFDLITFLLTFFSCQVVLFPSVIYAVFKPNQTLSKWPAIFSIAGGYLTAFILGKISTTNPVLQVITPVGSLGIALLIFLGIILGKKIFKIIFRKRGGIEREVKFRG